MLLCGFQLCFLFACCPCRQICVYLHICVCFCVYIPEKITDNEGYKSHFFCPESFLWNAEGILKHRPTPAFYHRIAGVQELIQEFEPGNQNNKCVELVPPTATFTLHTQLDIHWFVTRGIIYSALRLLELFFVCLPHFRE